MIVTSLPLPTPVQVEPEIVRITLDLTVSECRFLMNALHGKNEPWGETPWVDLTVLLNRALIKHERPYRGV
jgi:hypothetical protein